MDFQTKLKNLLSGAQQAVAPVAQNALHFGQSLLQAANPIETQIVQSAPAQYLAQKLLQPQSYIPTARYGGLPPVLGKPAQLIAQSPLQMRPDPNLPPNLDVGPLLAVGQQLGRFGLTGTNMLGQIGGITNVSGKGLGEASQIPELAGGLRNIANPLERALPGVGKSLADIVTPVGNSVNSKVNVLDYLRTPENVLQKIGLGNQAQALKQAQYNYQDALKAEMGQISQWKAQLPDPGSSQRVFKFLDGQSVQLNPQEEQVAGQIRQHLSDWADRLGLPAEHRISNYITHIFEKNIVTKEFDPELASIIQDKVPGSVYDPFTEQRLGKQGYVEDAFRALEAYGKRATRKEAFDPALEQLSRAADLLPSESYKYVQRYASQINMRPTEIDNLIDNAIKSSPVGYRFGARPVASLSRGFRQMVYRGALGLNVGSALKNLTQGTNTYAALGEKYTLVGYTKALAKIVSGDFSELQNTHVLDDNVVQDRTVSAVRGLAQKADQGLFALFDLAEKVNRGAAYYGAKAQALDKGLPEDQAVNFARDLVAKTQFRFSNVDTPVALGSDLGKLAGQFQSYNLKQTEFLGGMIKNKDVAGLTRWIGANLVLMGTVGKLFGMKPQDLIPFSRFSSPALDTAGDITGAAFGTGQAQQDSIRKLENQAKLFVPAGVQLSKTLGGLKDVAQGASRTASGKMRFQIPQDPATAARAALFGTNNLPQAQAYYNGQTPGSAPTQSLPAGPVGSDPLAQYAAQQQLAQLRKQEQGVLSQGSGIELPLFGRVGGLSDQQKLSQLQGLQTQEAQLQNQLNPLTNQKAQYALAADRAKRGDDVQGWLQLTDQHLKDLVAARSQLSPTLDQAKIAELTKQIEDLATEAVKYKSYGGFTKPKKGRKAKTVSFLKGIKTTSSKTFKVKTPKPRSVKVPGLSRSKRPSLKLKK